MFIVNVVDVSPAGIKKFPPGRPSVSPKSEGLTFSAYVSVLSSVRNPYLYSVATQIPLMLFSEAELRFTVIVAVPSASFTVTFSANMTGVVELDTLNKDWIALKG